MTQFLFDVWTIDHTGRCEAYLRPFQTLDQAQRAWAAQAERAVTVAKPSQFRSVGIGPIRSPKGGPWPREGEAGREGQSWDDVDMRQAQGRQAPSEGDTP